MGRATCVLAGVLAMLVAATPWAAGSSDAETASAGAEGGRTARNDGPSLSLRWTGPGGGGESSSSGTVGQPVEIALTGPRGRPQGRTRIVARVDDEGGAYRLTVRGGVEGEEREIYYGILGPGTEMDLRRLKDVPPAFDRGSLTLAFGTPRGRKDGPTPVFRPPSADRARAAGPIVHVEWKRKGHEALSGVFVVGSRVGGEVVFGDERESPASRIRITGRPVPDAVEVRFDAPEGTPAMKPYAVRVGRKDNLSFGDVPGAPAYFQGGSWTISIPD